MIYCYTKIHSQLRTWTTKASLRTSARWVASTLTTISTPRSPSALRRFFDNKTPLDGLFEKLGKPPGGYPYKVSTECLIRTNLLWKTSTDTEIEAYHKDTGEVQLTSVSRAACKYNTFVTQGEITFWGVNVRTVEDPHTGEQVNMIDFDHAEVELDSLKALRA